MTKILGFEPHELRADEVVNPKEAPSQTGQQLVENVTWSDYEEADHILEEVNARHYDSIDKFYRTHPEYKRKPWDPQK